MKDTAVWSKCDNTRELSIKDIATEAWNHRQEEITKLQEQLDQAHEKNKKILEVIKACRCNNEIDYCHCLSDAGIVIQK